MITGDLRIDKNFENKQTQTDLALAIIGNDVSIDLSLLAKHVENFNMSDFQHMNERKKAAKHHHSLNKPFADYCFTAYISPYSFVFLCNTPE